MYVHKITNVPVFYLALRLNDFDAGNIHYDGHWKGWALEMDFHPIKIITSRAI